MKPVDQTSAAAGERRSARRLPVHSKVRIHVEPQDLEGRADNVSHSGVLFFSNEPLRVTLEVEEDGVVKRMNGRIVRAQRIKGESIGWAVEVD